MKTSHEMAQSVLERRDRILRRRRILKTSFGAVAGVSAVAAALVVTLNISRPRGVDLIDPGTVSQPINPDVSGNDLVPSEAEEPQYLYNDVKIRKDAGAGSIDSYDLLVDHLEIYSGNMNFYEFTITKQYTSDEAVELTGSDIFLSGSTLFSAHISYDHLSGSEENMDILLAQAGNAESQIENSPLYGIGETYAAFLSGFDPESWNVACPELIFALNDDTKCLHINAEQIKLETPDGVQLGEEIPADEQYVCTTTSNNPVRYVRKYDIAELSDFLRSDWISRGLYAENALQSYTEFSNADIPDIPPSERGTEAMGARNILFDTKQAGDFSILLAGDYVSTDNEGHPGMVNCFHFGIQIYDGKTVSELSGAHFDLGLVGYWVYTDRLSDYMSVFQFGENYIIVLRYYEGYNSCKAAFFAIKDGKFYPELMGDYSAATGEQMGVTTLLSENLSVDEEACTITDMDNGISYVFDFDAISDTFTKPHYTAVKVENADREEISGQLSEMWLKKWAEISANSDFVLPQVSVFSLDLRNGSRLIGFVYPEYKSYGAVFYRISGDMVTELGSEMCGSHFVLLQNSSGQYLYMVRNSPGGAMNEESLYIDRYYYRITETSLEPVLSIGRQLYKEEPVDWYVYENGDTTHISVEEYENLTASAAPDCTIADTAELDNDGDYKVDEYCAFEDDPEGLKAAVLSVI